MFKKSLLVIVACAATAHAQGTEAAAPAPAPTPAPAPMPGSGGDAFQKGTMGVTFALDLTSALGPGTLGERIPTIGFMYFLSDNAALHLTGGLNVHKAQVTAGTPPMTTDTTVFGFEVGAGYRMYRPVKVGRVHPYLEPAVLFAWPDTGQSGTLLLGVGGQFGVECQLADWFTLSGGLGANLDFTNSFKNIQFATASTLAANLYWK